MFGYKPPPQMPFIRKLCAHLPDQEIEEAEARFLRYAAICERIAKEEVEREEQSHFDKSPDHP